ncbi:hypothetical protein AHiyo8_40750 [Arthrobacter sp. Hiyo8]|nr:hypothetical protein AHiyo8_40750 [Arthrobacter sp. Hiyo8]
MFGVVVDAVAQLEMLQFAAGVAGKFVDEPDVPRVLVGGDRPFDEVLDFLALRVIACDTFAQDDERADDAAACFVGRPMTAFSTTSGCRSMAVSTSGAPML